MATDTAPAGNRSLGIERRTIDMIPAEERHGTPFNQFTLWFGANLQITAIVDGALAVIFGADALWAIIGLFVGQVLGGIVMALIFFVLRPMMSRAPSAALADLGGLREFAPETARMLGVGAGELIELPPASATKIDRLREVIASRSEDSAAVLRAWIEAPEPRKEPAQS